MQSNDSPGVNDSDYEKKHHKTPDAQSSSNQEEDKTQKNNQKKKNTNKKETNKENNRQKNGNKEEKASVNEDNPLNIPEKPLDLRYPKDGYLFYPTKNHRQLKAPYGPPNICCRNSSRVRPPLPKGYQPRSVLTYANCATKSDQIYTFKRLWHVTFSQHFTPARVEFVWCNYHDISVAEAEQLSKRMAILSFQVLEIMRGHLNPLLIKDKTSPQMFDRIIHHKNVCDSRAVSLLFDSSHLPACVTHEHSFAISAQTVESTVRLSIGADVFLCNVHMNKLGCRWLATDLGIG
jgi:hypothetical protein